MDISKKIVKWLQSVEMVFFKSIIGFRFFYRKPNNENREESDIAGSSNYKLRE